MLVYNCRYANLQNKYSIVSIPKRKERKEKMANVKRGNTTKNTTKKEFKNQNYKMRGEIANANTFADDKHVRITIKDDVTERKYVFILFNATDEQYDILAESTKLEIYFNIGYDNYNNQIQLQLIATEVHNAD